MSIWREIAVLCVLGGVLMAALAEHTGLVAADPAAYESRIIGFLDQYLRP